MVVAACATLCGHCVILQRAAKEKALRERRRQVARRDVLSLRRALPAGEWPHLWQDKLLPKQGREWTSLWDVESSSDDDDDAGAVQPATAVPSPDGKAAEAGPASLAAPGEAVVVPTDAAAQGGGVASGMGMATAALLRRKLGRAGARAVDRVKSKAASLEQTLRPRPVDLEDMSWSLPVPTKVAALKEKLGADRQLKPEYSRDEGGDSSTRRVSEAASTESAGDVGGKDGSGDHGSGTTVDAPADNYAVRDERGRNKFAGKWGWSRYRHMQRPPANLWDKNRWSKAGQDRYGADCLWHPHASQLDL